MWPPESWKENIISLNNSGSFYSPQTPPWTSYNHLNPATALSPPDHWNIGCFQLFLSLKIPICDVE